MLYDGKEPLLNKAVTQRNHVSITNLNKQKEKKKKKKIRSPNEKKLRASRNYVLNTLGTTQEVTQHATKIAVTYPFSQSANHMFILLALGH